MDILVWRKLRQLGAALPSAPFQPLGIARGREGGGVRGGWRGERARCHHGQLPRPAFRFAIWWPLVPRRTDTLSTAVDRGKGIGARKRSANLRPQAVDLIGRLAVGVRRVSENSHISPSGR